MGSRKEQALYIMQTRYPAIAFAKLDGKDPAPMIWKILRPKGSNTFRKDIDI
jgi:RNA ligase